MNRRELGASAIFVVLATQAVRVSAQTATAESQTQGGFAIEHASVFNPVQVYGIAADLFIRSYFAELRAIPNWGPEHPAWARYLPSFSDDMLTLMLPPGLSLEVHLSAELQQKLSKQELSDLSISVSRPEFIAAINRLAQVGASWRMLVLIQMVMREPKFYSAEERKQAKGVVSALREEMSEERTSPLGEQVRPVAAFLDSSAFSSYQSVLNRAFMADAKRMGEAPEKRRGFELLMQRWHVRLKNDK